MTPLDLVLSRLEHVKKTGPGKWILRCRTREDRSPSLAIRELDDGRVLLHDFGGEDVESILAAIGLTFADLYPPQPGMFAKPTRRPFSAADVLALVAFEATVALLVCIDVAAGRVVTDTDLARLKTAAQRLGDAAEVCLERR